jgi:hypothetical protein
MQKRTWQKRGVVLASTGALLGLTSVTLAQGTGFRCSAAALGRLHRPGVDGTRADNGPDEQSAGVT